MMSNLGKKSAAAHRTILVVALCVIGAMSYLGPWNREFWFARADLLALDRRTAASPDDWLAWYHLGRRLEERAGPEQALAALQQAYRLRSNEPRVVEALAGALFRSNKIAEAFQVLKAAEETRSGSTGQKLLLARLYQRRGAYHRAVTEWEKALEVQPNNPETWYHLAFCRLQMQQVEKAVTAADRAIALQPKAPQFHRLRGSIAAASGDFRTARNCFEAAIRADPKDARSHHDLANFLLTQSRSAEDLSRAEEAVAQLVRLRPDYPLISWHRARLFFLRSEWSAAIRELRETLRTEPGLDEAHFHLANAYYRTGDRKRGDAEMAKYRRRAELTRRMDELRSRIAESDDPKLWFRLARLRREAKLFRLAREAVEEGLRLAPNAPEGLKEKELLEQAENAARSAA